MHSLLSRQKEIIIYLMDKTNYIPVKNIAENIRVSEKTVYRELKTIEEYLSSRYIFLEKRPGTGIKLKITKEQKMKLNFELHIGKENKNDYMSTEHRRQKILTEFLSNSPKAYSIQQLSEKYYISRASIVNDLKYIEDCIKQYDLRLERNKNGTMLTGSEMNIRKAILGIINELIAVNHENKHGTRESRLDDENLHELFGQFGREDVEAVAEILKETEQQLNYKMGEIYYINMITHVLILIKRLRHGNIQYENKIKTDARKTDERIHSISQEMAEKISETFKIEVHDEEIYFIYQYLISSGMEISNAGTDKSGFLLDTSPVIMDIAGEIIGKISEIADFKLKPDNQLYESLILHLKAMMNRLKYNISIKNPILEDIKKEFSAIYGLVGLVTLDTMEKYDIRIISPDEIGYLTFYFQAAIEQNMKQKKVLVVCSSGVGSSHLLRGRIRNSFPEWDIVDVISTGRLKAGYDLENIDLIISTINISDTGMPVAYVTALFNEADVRNVTEIYLKNALKSKNTVFSFKVIKKFLNKKYIQIENEIFSEKTSVKKLIKKIINENYLDKRNINEYISETHINKNFSVYLIKKEIVTKTRIGFRIKSNTSGEYKADIIIGVKDNDEVHRQLLKEIFELYNNKELLKKICYCRNTNEICELINLN
ncbi:PRD domain-containing protein [Sebaldella sp. S0638]|uniref:BglG family transcription antiterminator n=1 Tax=Sebaldella sp. S0638 TaxID=2957809 RepID=UPI0020A1C507|nr:PRD domain-containing protein [Sebaldella sp. S0638]MCP1224266.1 PRD domain-containing protein [Sebaldella sp. S0638]